MRRNRRLAAAVRRPTHSSSMLCHLWRSATLAAARFVPSIAIRPAIATPDEAGPEVVYRLVVDRALRVRAAVYDRGEVDVDIHLLGDRVGGDACLPACASLPGGRPGPGTYHLVVDTFVHSGTALAGEYLLTLIEDNGAQ